MTDHSRMSSRDFMPRLERDLGGYVPTMMSEVCAFRTKTHEKASENQGEKRPRGQHRSRDDGELPHGHTKPHEPAAAIGSGQDRKRRNLWVFGHDCSPIVDAKNADDKPSVPLTRVRNVEIKRNVAPTSRARRHDLTNAKGLSWW